MPPPLFSSMLCETLGQAAGVSGPRVPGAAQALYDAVVKCDALRPLALPLNKHSWVPKQFGDRLNTCGWSDCPFLSR
jgi:hypothetical protein